MIGVLAIIAIVASFVAPSLIRQVQTATAAGEDAKLDDIAQALTNAIKATGFIPNPNLDPAATNSAQGFGWAYLASNYTRLAGRNLISVFPGLPNDTQRRLYLSTNLAGTASNGGYNRTISNWGATFFPTNTKMYLVSASRPDFALLLPTNGPNAQGANNTNAVTLVNALESWIKVVSNGVVEAPASLVDGWTNKGEFLHVRTIDLAPIFNEARATQQKISDQEDKNLEEIARALTASIQANGQIPDPSLPATSAGGWAAMAQNYTSLGSTDLLNSFGTNATTQRRFYLSVNTTNYIQNQNGGNFQTTSSGWPTNNFPTDIYFVLVSSSKKDLNLNCPTNSNFGGSDVAWLKNWVKKADSLGIYPADNLNVLNWTNRGEFLHVKPVDLRPLFCRVQLIDTACPPTATITTFGDYTYANPNVSFFGGVAVFDIFDTALSPITPSRVLAGTDRVILRTPYPQFLGRASALGAANPLGGTAFITPAQVTPALNPQPRFLIPISGSATPPPAGLFPANVQTFYVLKGTALQLWDNASASSVLTTTIESDCSFKYFGNTWTKVD